MDSPAVDDYDASFDAGALCVIAKPLATGKAHEHAMKLVRKASKEKVVKRGVKEVVKALKKGAKGIVLLAGDVSPIDVITHIPVMCEDAGVAYAYVHSRAALGAAGSTRRPTCCVLIPQPARGAADSDVAKYYEKLARDISALSA